MCSSPLNNGVVFARPGADMTYNNLSLVAKHITVLTHKLALGKITILKQITMNSIQIRISFTF